jgi:signal transduction histidine kinase
VCSPGYRRTGEASPCSLNVQFEEYVLEERILIVAPHGRDAEVAEQVLSRGGMTCSICADAGRLVKSLEEGAACALIAEEALDSRTLHALETWLNTQPPWSDFPFVLLLGNGKKGTLSPEGRRLEVLGNVVLIERPVSREALVSGARSAIRARRRQYQARALISERAAANAQLLRTARQKDEFLAMLAHELRNPLAPIRNAAEVLRMSERGLPPRVQWAGEMIERQSRHLSNLLEDLLDMSRITTGKVTLKRQVIELGSIISAATELSRHSIDGRHHSLDVRLPDMPVYLHADPTRMAQVFGNLLDNAAKYTPAGGHITVTAAVDGGRVVVTVEDNGTGISPEDLPLIFELFSQSSRALDRAQGGLGIGLSVVRSLIRMHGGVVEAQSEGIGLGARIVVTLPVVPASPDPDDPPPDTVAEQQRGLHILVVDDNVDAADSLSILLEMSGHKVRTAFDGPGALAECRIRQPDVVLLDIGLPGMDGYEVARRLKRIPAMSDSLLIAITGYGQADDIARSKNAGFDHHLVKPVKPEHLMALFHGK